MYLIEQSETLLHRAVKYGKYNSAVTLIELGSDINARDTVKS